MHIPVLLKEAIEILKPEKGEFFIDGTFGSGGHARMIAEKIGKDGTLLGVDWDERNISQADKETKEWPAKIILISGNFAELKEILAGNNLDKADGLILDLGFSSEQLAGGRGFSFLKDEILDMRYATGAAGQFVTRPESGLARREDIRLTAAEVINSFRKEQLEEIFRLYGEERYSRRAAEEIVKARRKKRILTTAELAGIAASALPKSYEKGRIHPATRIFQALRIYVNGELENIERVLSDLSEILKPKGRAAVISFHSLEDRLVKKYFNNLSEEGRAKILTKKPIIASREETEENPRARSAKMRAIQLK